MEAVLGSVALAKAFVILSTVLIVCRAGIVMRSERQRWVKEDQERCPPPLTQAERDAAREELNPGIIRREWEARQAAAVRRAWGMPDDPFPPVGGGKMIYPKRKIPPPRPPRRPYGVLKGPMPQYKNRAAPSGWPLGSGELARRPSQETLIRLLGVMQRCRGELFSNPWMKAMATDGAGFIIYIHDEWRPQWQMIEFAIKMHLGNEAFSLAWGGTPETAPHYYIFSMPESQ